MSKSSELAAINFVYITIKGIDIKSINTHSLRSRGGGGVDIQREEN